MIREDFFTEIQQISDKYEHAQKDDFQLLAWHSMRDNSLSSLKIFLEVYLEHHDDPRTIPELHFCYDIKLLLLRMDEFTVACSSLEEVAEEYIHGSNHRSRGWLEAAKRLQTMVQDLYKKRDPNAKEIIQDFCNTQLVGWTCTSTTLKPKIEQILNSMPINMTQLIEDQHSKLTDEFTILFRIMAEKTKECSAAMNDSQFFLAKNVELEKRVKEQESTIQDLLSTLQEVSSELLALKLANNDEVSDAAAALPFNYLSLSSTPKVDITEETEDAKRDSAKLRG